MRRQKSTNELLQILNSTENVSDLYEYSQSEELHTLPSSVHEYLLKHMCDAGITASELIRRSQIQRNYGYQILNGTKKPGRDKIIALCISLALPLDEVQRALAIAQEGTLYPKCRRDSILIFSINQKISVQETNELLYSMDEAPLN